MLHFYQSQMGKKNYQNPLLLAASFFVLLFLGTFKTSAQNYVVNTTADTHAAVPGAGTGVDGSGNISLRSAIEDANARPAGTLHTHNITFSTTGTISLSLGQIVVGTGGFTIETTANGGATQVGTTATIKTTSNHNFVVGQQVAVYPRPLFSHAHGPDVERGDSVRRQHPVCLGQSQLRRGRAGH